MVRTILLGLLLLGGAACSAPDRTSAAPRPDGGRDDAGTLDSGLPPAPDQGGPACVPTRGGREICDGLDNDCNGLVDDLPPGDPRLLTDPDHCGRCYHRCEFPHAFGDCQGGECVLGPCETGYLDLHRPLLGEAEDGCETRCETDQYQQDELCDGLDNNCDGQRDEGFDLQTDPLHCGGCNHSCLTLPQVREANCIQGECAIVACRSGFADNNQTVADGCEYPCIPLPGGEQCNGLDDDCDGQTDEQLQPPITCWTEGVCQGAAPVCRGRAGWSCSYPTDLLETPEEISCDGLDNDCDGLTDESFPQKGAECGVGHGRCRGVGRWECTPTGRALRCTGQARPEQASPELCNGLDDDCDGQVDQEVVDLAWVQVGNLRIYQFESSRPDATAQQGGQLMGRACSKIGVQPWHDVTHEEAALACALGGWRLCTREELAAACRGPAQTNFPYGNDFLPGACNDAVRGEAEGEAPPVAVAPTGAFPDCESPYGAFDLSGNLREWTATAADPDQAGVHLVVGGSYDSAQPAALECAAAGVPRADEFRFPNLGFRCCLAVGAL